MARLPENGVKKGPWSIEEDQKLIEYIEKHGCVNWQTLPKKVGLNRCGKSCRLRWTNYLRPGIKRGGFSAEEEATIIALHEELGNKWSTIAAHLPRRTDNDIKNFWNTHLRKKLLKMGIDPTTHKPIPPDSTLLNLSQAQLLSVSNMYTFLNPLDAALNIQENANDLVKFQLLQNFMQAIKSIPLPYFHGNTNLGDLVQLNRLFERTNSYLTVDFSRVQSMIGGFSNNSPLPPQQYTSTSNSLPGFDCEVISGPILDDNVKDTSNIYSSEYSLPSLVSVTPESSIVNTLESFRQSYMPAGAPHEQSNVFDACQYLAGDEASSSFWNDILG